MKEVEINEEDLIPEESRVGKKLTDLTQRRLIILVLAMLFSIPACSVTTYFTEPDSYSFGLKLLTNYNSNSIQFNKTFEAFVETQKT